MFVFQQLPDALKEATHMAAQLALRLNAANPNHHLWNNHGTWWCHYTLHEPDYTKRRVRVSLGTPDVAEARRRRDLLLAQVPTVTGDVALAAAQLEPLLAGQPSLHEFLVASGPSVDALRWRTWKPAIPGRQTSRSEVWSAS